jgi:hypothetical protein
MNCQFKDKAQNIFLLWCAVCAKSELPCFKNVRHWREWLGWAPGWQTDHPAGGQGRGGGGCRGGLGCRLSTALLGSHSIHWNTVLRKNALTLSSYLSIHIIHFTISFNLRALGQALLKCTPWTPAGVQWQISRLWRLPPPVSIVIDSLLPSTAAAEVFFVQWKLPQWISLIEKMLHFSSFWQILIA